MTIDHLMLYLALTLIRNSAKFVKSMQNTFFGDIFYFFRRLPIKSYLVGFLLSFLFNICCTRKKYLDPPYTVTFVAPRRVHIYLPLYIYLCAG